MNAATYREIADEHGLQLDPPDAGFGTQHISFFGPLDGRNVRVKLASEWVYSTVEFRQPLMDEPFAITTEALTAKVKRWFGTIDPQDMVIGVPDFDAKYAIRCTPQSGAALKRILVPELCAELSAIGMDSLDQVSVEYSSIQPAFTPEESVRRQLARLRDLAAALEAAFAA